MIVSMYVPIKIIHYIYKKYNAILLNKNDSTRITHLSCSSMKHQHNSGSYLAVRVKSRHAGKCAYCLHQSVQAIHLSNPQHY